MSLRDTLNKNQEAQRKQAEFEAQKPAMIVKRQATVKALFDEIEGFLKDFIQDGSVTVQRSAHSVEEYQFATYPSEILHINLAGKNVEMIPTGVVLGGGLRFNIVSQGRGQNECFIIVYDDKTQIIRTGQNNINRGAQRKELEFNAENFETVLDELIQAMR